MPPSAPDELPDPLELPLLASIPELLPLDESELDAPESLPELPELEPLELPEPEEPLLDALDPELLPELLPFDPLDEPEPLLEPVLLESEDVASFPPSTL